MRTLWVVAFLAVVIMGGVSVVGDGDGLSFNEEVSAGTAPFLADTDFDGLNDGEEQRIGTNLLSADTDGDGLPDGAEASLNGPVSEGDPLRWDVFVEVDTIRTNDETPEFSSTNIKQVKQGLSNAPIENPDGTTGVTLHIHYDETMERDSSEVINNEYWQIRQNHHDMQGRGYYYIVLVEDVRESEEKDGLTGYAWSGAGGLVEDHGYGTEQTFMHELGHAFGLLPETYAGIDSRDIEPDRYRSIMNYAYPCNDCEPYRFSGSESSFNDWAYIEDNYQAPSASQLENPLSELF